MQPTATPVVCLLPVGGPHHGAQKVSLHVIAALQQRFANVCVIDMAQAITANDFNHFRIGKVVAALQRIWQAWRLSCRQSRVYMNVTPHGLAMGRDLLVLTLLRCLGRDITAHIHALPRSWWTRWLLSHALARVKVVVVNERIAAYLPGKRRRAIIPNSVPDFYQSETQLDSAQIDRRFKARRLLFASRLSQQKGVLEAVRLFQGLLRRLPDVSLHLVGAAECHELHAALKALSLEEPRLVLHGAVALETMHQHYDSATISLFTSQPHSEGDPLVIVETAMHGLPLVSTAQASLNSAHVVLHQADDLEATLVQMERLLTDAEIYRQSALAARQRYKAAFDYDVFKHQMLALIAE